jgi:hypothetical protein
MLAIVAVFLLALGLTTALLPKLAIKCRSLSLCIAKRDPSEQEKLNFISASQRRIAEL